MTADSTGFRVRREAIVDALLDELERLAETDAYAGGVYANVKNAHIVPASYLRSWSIDGKIGVHQVEEGRDLVLPVEKVGTRRRYYRRSRPRDGVPIDDIEWSLSELENVVSPVLRELEERWPPDDEDRSKLAHLFAYQLLRSPRHKAEYENLVRHAIADFQSGRGDPLSAEGLAAAEEALLSDTQRLTRMLISGMTLTSVFASTHWTLVEFGSPVLATSDQPAVLWPGAEARTPQPTLTLGAGVMECIEYRLPLSPTRALLMTWSDMPDDAHVRARGSHQHAMNLNAFTIASADRQWFYVPGTRPPRAAGFVSPLAPELVPGYTEEGARLQLPLLDPQVAREPRTDL